MRIKDLDNALTEGLWQKVYGYGKRTVGFLAAFVGFDLAIGALEGLINYYERVNFRPDPRAVPNGLRMKFVGGDGKSYWMKWDAFDGVWYNPENSRFKMPLGNKTNAEQFYAEGFKKALTTTGYVDASDVTKSDLKRAMAFVDAEKIMNKQNKTSDWKALDRLYDEYVLKADRNERKAWTKATSAISLKFVGWAAIWGPAFYYWHNCNEIRLALESSFKKGDINRQQYEQGITTIRAGFGAVLASTIVGAAVGRIIAKSFTFVGEALLAKQLSAAEKAAKSKKIKIAGFLTAGLIGTYLAGTERGQRLVVNGLNEWFGEGWLFTVQNIDGTQQWVYDHIVAPLMGIIIDDPDSYVQQAAEQGIAPTVDQQGYDTSQAVKKSVEKFNITPGSDTSSFKPGETSSNYEDFLKKQGF